jgi:homoserine kinase type II
MDTGFLLWYTGPADIEDEAWLIGVFRTEQEANEAINALAHKPGFVDYPDGFLISPYGLGKRHWTEGFAIPKD